MKHRHRVAGVGDSGWNTAPSLDEFRAMAQRVQSWLPHQDLVDCSGVTKRIVRLLSSIPEQDSAAEALANEQLFELMKPLSPQEREDIYGDDADREREAGERTDLERLRVPRGRVVDRGRTLRQRAGRARGRCDRPTRRRP